MQETSKYTVFNIREYLNGQNDELGEDDLIQVLSGFSCEINPDVEKFAKAQSIEFAKKQQSVTYLVFSTEDAELVEEYGEKRVAYVLSATLQMKSWDGRFSNSNKEWADKTSIPENIVMGDNINTELIVSSHPAVLDGFVDLFRKEIRERELDIGKGQDTSGHDVQKPADIDAERKPEDAHDTEDFSEETMDGDEIIDLGDEREQVLAEMKGSLTDGNETELAFQIADRYISIQEVDGDFDYSIMDIDYKEIDGGVYESPSLGGNPDISIREALKDVVEDLRHETNPAVKGGIMEDSELIPIDYDGLMENVEEANRVIPEKPQSSVVENFKAKTNELFHEISDMNPSEIEETIRCHVQAKLDEYGIDAQIVDVAVTGTRCRGLEREGSDLDVVVELSTDEREDMLFDTFNEDGLSIGGIKVDIRDNLSNPINHPSSASLEELRME